MRISPSTAGEQSLACTCAHCWLCNAWWKSAAGMSELLQLRRSEGATDCAARAVVCTSSFGRPAPAGLRAVFTLHAGFHHHHWSSFWSVQTVSIYTQSCCLQGLHSVAFTGALGRPLICPEGGIHNMSADTLHEFVSTNFIAPKMVLAGAGVEHKALLSLAEPMLSTVEGGSASPQPESKYAGGDYR